jgi:hypothetical protein
MLQTVRVSLRCYLLQPGYLGTYLNACDAASTHEHPCLMAAARFPYVIIHQSSVALYGAQ